MSDALLDPLTPLLERFAATAAERDRQGGTPKTERDALRQSGLLALSIPRNWAASAPPGTRRWRQCGGWPGSTAPWPTSSASIICCSPPPSCSASLRNGDPGWRAPRAMPCSGERAQPLDRRTLARRHGDAWQVDGQKSFCSGALDSDLLLLSALENDDSGRLLIAVVPTGRAGIQLFDDWTTTASARPTAAARASTAYASNSRNGCSTPAR